MSDYVKRLRDARNWFNNDGQCCGQVDSVGTCAAPACIFGEALKEFYQAADRIEAQAVRIETLEAALRGLDDMIVDLDAGHRELHEVSRFINGALAGWKR